MTNDNPLEILRRRPIELWDYPRIVVGVLQERAMSYSEHVFYNFWALAQQGVPIIKMPYDRIDVARNKLAVELLRSEMTHLLMLDIDHKHPRDIIPKLARWTLIDPFSKVVGGLNFRRREPYDACCGFWNKDKTKYFAPADWKPGLIKVDAIGTGSILIAREVFEIIEPPWFAFDYSRVWADEWPGEDLYFSKLCNDHNIDLYVDTTVTSPHLTVAMVNDVTFKDHLEKSGTELTTYEEFMERVEQQA